MAMDTLTFRTTPRQLRKVRRVGLAFCVPAILLVYVTAASGAAWNQGVGHFALIIAAAAVTLLVVSLLLRRSFTECTPEGIRTRMFGSPKAARWAEVADISAGTVNGGTSITVITTGGKKIRLGAPASGVLTPDPEFAGKLAQILMFWHSSVPAAPAMPVLPAPRS